MAGLLGLATASASLSGSPLSPGAPELSDLPSTAFLAAAALGVVLYALALCLLRRRRPGLLAVCAVAGGTRTVYGPVFSAASAGVARAMGRSAETAALVYRVLAALGMLAAVVALVGLAAPFPAFAVAASAGTRSWPWTSEAAATTTSG